MTRQYYTASAARVHGVLQQHKSVLQSLRAVFGADGSWSLGWTLGPSITPNIQAHIIELACKPSPGANVEAVTAAAASAAEVQWATTDSCAQGSMITAVGSPFGVMAPHHFSSICLHGVISNHWLAEGATGGAFLMADMRCLPGMEGGPVFNQQGQLVAVTMLPLHSKAFGAEVSFRMHHTSMTVRQMSMLTCFPSVL